ncbi:MAG: phosphotransferase family protein [Bacteroidia bacterium]
MRWIIERRAWEIWANLKVMSSDKVEGWTRRYQKAKTDEVAEIDQLAKWLAENMPGESASALIHNDFKYDNLVLDPDDWSKVIAVLDWEMATLGDPLMDLGTSLAYWMDPNDPPEILMLQLSPTTLPGNPDRRQVAEMYAQASGRDLGDLVFYYAFGMFKIAVIVQQIYYRFKKGYTKDPRFAMLNHAVKGCGVMGMQAIRKGRIDGLFAS